MQRPGIALVNVLIFVVLSSLFLSVGMQFVDNNRKIGRESGLKTQVYHVAEAGINEAISWLRQQELQPVESFSPSGGITLDDKIGLVREWEIDPARKLWGRFEVGGVDAKPDIRAVDVSLERGEKKPGTIWRLRSRGLLFEKNSKLVISKVNRNLETITLETDVRRDELKFREAALYSYISGSSTESITDGTGAGGHIDIHAHDATANTQVRVYDGTALSLWANTPASKVSRSGVQLWGPTQMGITDTSNRYYVSANPEDQLSYVFGTTSVEGIRPMATDTYNELDDVPEEISGLKFVFIKARGHYKNDRIIFNKSNRLQGSGVIFVDGHVRIDGNDLNQTWEGLIFATGDYEQEKTSTIRGAVVTGGKAMIHGYNGKVAKLEFSKEALNAINDHLVTYREHRSTRTVVGEP